MEHDAIHNPVSPRSRVARSNHFALRLASENNFTFYPGLLKSSRSMTSRRSTNQWRVPRNWLLIPRGIAKAGGANRDRTDDLLLAKQALSQLSYGPRTEALRLRLVGLDGFEPSTPALSRRCSNQLSYRPAWVAQKKLLPFRRTADRWWALDEALFVERR
jgi:hypothetical protein